MEDKDTLAGNIGAFVKTAQDWGFRAVFVKAADDITTDIIMPSSHFASEWKGEGRSPMPDYTRTMTVRQLADLVAFVQSKIGVGL